MNKSITKTEIIKFEIVQIRNKGIPDDYHCNCKFCRKYLGELIRADGTHYKRTDRKKYYDYKYEVKHFAKTPLHVARWAIQNFSRSGDWVLDPTMGAGTTAVEAINHGRNAFGVEIQFIDVIEANIKKQSLIGHTSAPISKVIHEDARNIRKVIRNNFDKNHKFDLIVNNPPYSGDQTGEVNKKQNLYDKTLKNLAFAKEGPLYWDDMQDIYSGCTTFLKPGGFFVIAVKDMMRNKKPFMLHKMFAKMMNDIPDLRYVGMALLLHYPTTLFLNTYPKRYGIEVPKYQTILVFQKEA
jgi:DNA modification methylase